MRSLPPAALTPSKASSIVKKALREQAIGVSMFTRSLSALACLILGGAALAQVSTSRLGAARSVLGKAVDVKGLVTVSDQWGVSRVVLNNAVVDRSRFVTSSSGSATLRMDDGCDIELKPNQALTIDHEKSCAVLWASMESLGNPSGLLLANGVSPGSLVPFAVGGVAILLMGNHGSAGNTPAAGGSTPGGGGNTPADGGTPPGGGGNTPGGGGNTPGDGGNTPGGPTGNPDPGGGGSIPTPPPAISPQ
jgi:hypothetical protein